MASKNDNTSGSSGDNDGRQAGRQNAGASETHGNNSSRGSGSESKSNPDAEEPAASDMRTREEQGPGMPNNSGGSKQHNNGRGGGK